MLKIGDGDAILKYADYKQAHPEIYEELILALQELGIDALLISVEERSESHCGVQCAEGDPHARKHRSGAFSKGVPALTLYIRTHENYTSLHIDKRTNNWDSTVPQTSAIRAAWRALLEQHNLLSTESYDGDMLVFFRDMSEAIISAQVYAHRDAVEQTLRKLSIVRPKWIFRCSEPGYRVVYASCADYERAQDWGEFEQVRAAILRVLEAAVPDVYRQDLDALLRVTFFHPDMPECNLYGMSRED